MPQTNGRCQSITQSPDREPNFKYRGNRKRHVGALIEMIRTRKALGWMPYLLTLQFRQLPGSPKTIMQQMMGETEVFYSKLAGRSHRHPTSGQAFPNLPLLMACSDVPIPKHVKRKIADVKINEGLHMHGVLAIPPCSRIRIDLPVYLMVEEDLFLQGSRLSAIFCKPMDDDLEKSVPYIFKAFESGRLDYDEATLILPRTRSEIVTKTGQLSA